MSGTAKQGVDERVINRRDNRLKGTDVFDRLICSSRFRHMGEMAENNTCLKGFLGGSLSTTQIESQSESLNLNPPFDECAGLRR